MDALVCQKLRRRPFLLFRDQVMVQKALRDDLISNSIRIKYKNIGIFQI